MENRFINRTFAISMEHANDVFPARWQPFRSFSIYYMSNSFIFEPLTATLSLRIILTYRKGTNRLPSSRFFAVHDLYTTISKKIVKTKIFVNYFVKTNSKQDTSCNSIKFLQILFPASYAPTEGFKDHDWNTFPQ